MGDFAAAVDALARRLVSFHAAIVYTPNGGSYVQALAQIRATGGSLAMAALSGFLWEANPAGARAPGCPVRTRAVRRCR